MPKLLLIQPPIRDFYDTEMRLQPIGLAYLKAAVLRHLPEWEVKIIDFHRGHGRQTVALPAELHDLRAYYPYADASPFCGFHEFFHFGAAYPAIAERVAAEAPDVVGLSCLFSPYYREVLETAAAIKSRLNVPIVVGGSHVSAHPESVLENTAIDFVIRGEGEKALVDFLVEWRRPTPDWRQVTNLGYKEKGALQFNPLTDNFPMEDLPIPDLSDFQVGDYRYQGKPLAFLVTSRSCPHRCSFCSVHATFGFQYRRNPVARVMAEIETRYAQGYRVLDFEDDNLSFYQDEMAALCDQLIARFPEGELQLLAMNGISYLSLNAALLTKMKRAGFTHLNLALVSSDTSVREATKRPHTVEKFLEVVAVGHRLGFEIVSYQILGLPDESLASMIQTLSFAARLPVRLGASPFYLTPNSPIAKRLGFVHQPADIVRSRLTAMAIPGADFARDDLYTLFLATRVFNFLKSLDLPADTELTTVLSDPDRFIVDKRERLGLRLLRHFFKSGEFCAASPQGWKVLPRFLPNLFLRLWQGLDWIHGKNGALFTQLQDSQSELTEHSSPSTVMSPSHSRLPEENLI